MRISNNSPYYRPTVQKARTGNTSFGQQLDIAARQQTDRCDFGCTASAGQWGKASACCQLMDDYRAWRAKQPPQTLPDSRGPTKENVDYLKERYSGDLSWQERVDALETMVQMGVITRDQQNEAMGCRLITLDCSKVYVGLNEETDTSRQSDDWNIFFAQDPIGSFKTADNLFAWLDTILTEEN